MTMGSRIAVMRDGRIQQLGEPLEIYQRPVNLFVANFIGTPPMNLLRARMEKGGIASLAAGTSLSLRPSNRPPDASAGRNVVLGIRPENVVDAKNGGEGPTASLPLEVDFVEPLGDEVIVHGRVGEEALLCKLAPNHVPEPGSRLMVALELSRMHVFDAETELRLIA